MHLGPDPIGLEQLRGLQRVEHGAAGGDHGDVVAVAQARPLAQPELVARRRDGLEVLAREAQVERALVLGRERDDLLGLDLVRRLDDGDVGQRADAGDVLEPHLAVAVLADRDARVRPHELHVRVGVGDRDADRLEAPDEEARERGGERHLARHGEPRRHADHVRLGDADVERAIRILLREGRRHRRLREVGVERDDARVLGSELDQGFPERGARRFGWHRSVPLTSCPGPRAR